MKVGLLFGGKSFEHDISIITANVIYHAIKENYEVILLYIDRNGDLKIPKKMKIDEFIKGRKFKRFTFVKNGVISGYKKIFLDAIISTMHGTNGEDGLSAMIANLYGIPYVGSNHISSSVTIDKYFTYAVLRSDNIKTVSTKYYLKGDIIAVKKFPVIIKPARLGSSIGISKVNNIFELEEKLKLAFLYDDKIIIQPFIENFKEYNQAAYFSDGKIVTSNVEEVFKSKDILSFDDKYINSKTEKKHAFITDEILIEKITKITKKVYSSLELSGVVRIDYMLVDDVILVNEINTIPGSLAYYLFEQNIDKLMSQLIKNALLEHQNKKHYGFESSVLSQKFTYKK